MLKVSCDSSNDIELDRGFCVLAGCTLGTEDGFFSRAAGSAHCGGVWEIGDCRRDNMNDLSYTILVPPGVVE